MGLLIFFLHARLKDSLQCVHVALHHLGPNSGLGIIAAMILLAPIATLVIMQQEMPSAALFLTIYTAYFTSLSTSVAAYRLSLFYPLAMYPGPVLGKITKLYGARVSWTGQQHLINHSLHQKYGNFVRVGKSMSLGI